MRRLATAVALVVALSGCSGESEPAEVSATSTPQTSATSAPATTVGNTTAAPATTTSTTEAPAAPEVLRALDAAGAVGASFGLSATGTHRPTFVWDAADGADRYLAIVVDESGAVLWSWAGEATSVTVGAGAADRAGAGARLVRAGWLRVIALNDDGITAISDVIPVG